MKCCSFVSNEVTLAHLYSIQDLIITSSFLLSSYSVNHRLIDRLWTIAKQCNDETIRHRVTVAFWQIYIWSPTTTSLTTTSLLLFLIQRITRWMSLFPCLSQRNKDKGLFMFQLKPVLTCVSVLVCVCPHVQHGCDYEPGSGGWIPNRCLLSSHHWSSPLVCLYLAAHHSCTPSKRNRRTPHQS